MEVISLSTQRRRQLVDITGFVHESVARAGLAEGLCLVHVPHTTAAVTVNENADPDVCTDLLAAFEKLLPAVAWRHGEGNSDAHLLSTMIGASVTLPVRASELQLGRWQAVYFVELDGPRRREVWITVIGH